MPEGHSVHRTAIEFRKHFVGHPVEVTSPQGRFSSAGQQISGRVMTSALAIGKQLFLYFETDEVVRIHLGIYGKWRFENFSQKPPEPIGQVRARFMTDQRFADLRGPTACELLDLERASELRALCGPDPLGDDPVVDVNRFVSKVQRSKTAIGLLLMNQQVISGIGNVYRAELLFRAGISPHRAGADLTEAQVVGIWEDAVRLMKVGVKKGVMVTRDEFLTGRLPVKADRNFVYKRAGESCRVCGTSVAIELMATRKLYWCPNCQK